MAGNSYDAYYKTVGDQEGVNTSEPLLRQPSAPTDKSAQKDYKKARRNLIISLVILFLLAGFVVGSIFVPPLLGVSIPVLAGLSFSLPVLPIIAGILLTPSFISLFWTVPTFMKARREMNEASKLTMDKVVESTPGLDAAPAAPTPAPAAHTVVSNNAPGSSSVSEMQAYIQEAERVIKEIDEGAALLEVLEVARSKLNNAEKTTSASVASASADTHQDGPKKKVSRVGKRARPPLAKVFSHENTNPVVKADAVVTQASQAAVQEGSEGHSTQQTAVEVAAVSLEEAVLNPNDAEEAAAAKAAEESAAVKAAEEAAVAKAAEEAAAAKAAEEAAAAKAAEEAAAKATEAKNEEEHNSSLSALLRTPKKEQPGTQVGGITFLNDDDAGDMSMDLDELLAENPQLRGVPGQDVGNTTIELISELTSGDLTVKDFETRVSNLPSVKGDDNDLRPLSLIHPNPAEPTPGALTPVRPASPASLQVLEAVQMQIEQAQNQSESASEPAVAAASSSQPVLSDDDQIAQNVLDSTPPTVLLSNAHETVMAQRAQRAQKQKEAAALARKLSDKKQELDAAGTLTLHM